MSAAAALRSACRALGRPSSFPGSLLGKPQFSPAMKNIIPRRLYYTSGRITKADERIITDLEGIDQKADNLNDMCDKTLIRLEHLKQVLRENNKRARRKKMLVRGSIFIGVAIFAKKHFFGKGYQQDN